MNPITWLRRRPEGFWVAVIILAVLAVGAVLTLVYWDWLRGWRNREHHDTGISAS